METLARGRVSGDFHKRTVDALTQQAAAANRTLADERARAAEDKARDASEMEALRAQVQEQSKVGVMGSAQAGMPCERRGVLAVLFGFGGLWAGTVGRSLVP